MNNALDFVPKDAKRSHIKFDKMSMYDKILVVVPAGTTGNITHYYCPKRSTLEKQGN